MTVNPTHALDFLVTPETAASWLAQWQYEHQRKIRSYHVEVLANEIKKGRFRDNTQVNFCFLAGRYYLTNGQHTLSAIVKSNIPCRLCVSVKNVFSLEEIADDFSRHDTHLTRKLSDTFAAHDTANNYGVTPTELSWISAAALYCEVMTGNQKARNLTQLSFDDKMVYTKQWLETGSAVLHAMQGYMNLNYINRRTTLAPMMLAYMNAEEEFNDFFPIMAQDDGLKQGDPRKTLLEFLKESRSVGSSSGTVKIRKTYPQHMLVKHVVAAWNAHIKKSQLKHIRADVSAKKIKMHLVGEIEP